MKNPEMVANLREVAKTLMRRVKRSYFPSNPPLSIYSICATIRNGGHTSKKDIGELLYHIADMLEE